MGLPCPKTSAIGGAYVLLGFFLVLDCSNAAARGRPSHEGISNFGKVDEGLYRGAQPGDEALRALKRLGVKSIINLRMPNDDWKTEPQFAHDNGILYTNVPLRGLGRPTSSQVSTVLKLIQTLPAPVFIHCAHGCDRTGTIVACYRIQKDKWTSRAALREAKTYGMSLFERGMKKFVLDFARAVPSRPPSESIAAVR